MSTPTQVNGNQADYNFSREDDEIVITGNTTTRVPENAEVAFADGNITISTTTNSGIAISGNSSDDTPNLTMLADGGYVLTWQAWGSLFGGDFDGIQMQRYSKTGELLQETSIPMSGVDDPSVTALDNGGFILTWGAEAAKGGSSVYTQAFDAAGNKSGKQLTVATSPSNEMEDAKVTVLKNGKYIVTWQEEREIGSSETADLKAQIFNSNGTLATPNSKPFALYKGEEAGMGADFQAILPKEGGGFWMTWAIETSSGTGQDKTYKASYVVQEFDAKGRPVGDSSNLQSDIFSAPNSANFAITPVADGYVVSWLEQRTVQEQWGPVSVNVIMTQHYDGDFAESTGPVEITSDKDYINGPGLTSTPDNGYLLTWATSAGGYWDEESSTWVDTPASLYAQRFNADGSPVDTDPILVASPQAPFSILDTPAVTVLPDGSFVVSWEVADTSQPPTQDPDEGDFEFNSDLYAQRFDKDGKPVGAITTLTGDNSDNTLTWNDDETVILKGGAGDDTLQGGSGSDILHGGSGDDTAVFAGQDAEYSFSLNPDGSLKVTGKDASDALYDIEKAQFDNGAISIDIGRSQLGEGAALSWEPNGTLLEDGSYVQAWENGEGEALKFQIFNEHRQPIGEPVVIEGAGDVGNPYLAAFGDGFIFAWSTPQGVSYQLYNAVGEAKGAPQSIALKNPSAGIDDLAMTDLGNGRYAITWSEAEESAPENEWDDGDTISSDAWVQVFELVDGALKPVSDATQIDIPKPGKTHYASENGIAAQDDGSFVIVWERETNDSSDVYLQRFDQNGKALGTPQLVNKSTAGDQYGAEVTALESGGYVVTWTSTTAYTNDEYESPKNGTVYMQRFDANGKKLGGETKVNTTAGIYGEPAITALKGGEGNYVITWATSDEIPTVDGIDNGQLFAQMFDKNGNKISAELLIARDDDHLFPTVTATADGGFIVTWEELRNVFDQDTSKPKKVGELHSQYFDKNGNSIALNGDENANTITWTGATGATGANLSGGAGDDTLNGGNGSDALNGGEGNDRLNGGAGADYMAGGTGDDTYVFDNAKDLIIERTDEGDDTVESSITWTLGDNLENLTLTGDKAINGNGNELNNVLSGNAANNILSGGAGDDTLDGGAGNDTLNGGDGNDHLDGGAGVDKLAGGAGDDTYEVDLIVKGKGKSATLALQDSVIEKANDGDDTLNLRADAKTLLLMKDASKTTTVTLAANLEHLDASATGDIALNLVGHKNAKSLTGNSGANTLDAKGGAAELSGLDGNDTYVVYSKEDLGRIHEEAGKGDDTLQIAFKSTAAKGERTTIDLADVEYVENINVTGTGLFELIGNAEDNRLSGNNSGTLMAGGAGDDTYVLNHKDDIIQENVGEGTDTIETSKFSIDLTLAKFANVENVTLTGKAALNANGNNQANTLIGNDGNNILNGGKNDGIDFDTLRGGKGNDTYILNNVGDVVEELANEGIDTIKTEALDIDLADYANVENVILTGDNHLNATGNDQANTLTGNKGNNKLDGGKGVDKLIGGAGDDEYTVDLIVKGKGKTASLALEDIVTEKAKEGDDTLQLRISEEELAQVKEALKDATKISTVTLAATLENLDASETGDIALNLTGNAGNNIIVGNAGDNIIIGGTGADTMTGGAGADTFKFTSLKDLGLNEGQQDVILDFESGVDTLDFSALKGYALVDKNSFGNTAKQLHWETLKDDGGNDYVMVYGNTDKDADPEFSIKLVGISELTKDDFIGLI